MNSLRTLRVLPSANLVLVASVHGGDAKLPVEVGGPFEARTVKNIAYAGGKDGEPKKHVAAPGTKPRSAAASVA